MTLWQLYAQLCGSGINWDLCQQIRRGPGPTHTSDLTRTLLGYAETVGRRSEFFDHAGSRRSVVWRRVGATLMVGLYGFGILFAMGGDTELLTPDHRMIGVAHMPLLALLLWTAWLDWRWWVSLRSPG